MSLGTVCRVRQVVGQALGAGCCLRTPDRSVGVDFTVVAVDGGGVRVRTANGSPLTITWEELGGAVAHLGERGEEACVIGAVHHNSPDRDTLEWLLRRISGRQTSKASYVASILGTAGIAIVNGDRRPNTITLSPEWRRR